MLALYEMLFLEVKKIFKIYFIELNYILIAVLNLKLLNFFLVYIQGYIKLYCVKDWFSYGEEQFLIK